MARERLGYGLRDACVRFDDGLRLGREKEREREHEGGKREKKRGR